MRWRMRIALSVGVAQRLMLRCGSCMKILGSAWCVLLGLELDRPVVEWILTEETSHASSQYPVPGPCPGVLTVSVTRAIREFLAFSFGNFITPFCSDNAIYDFSKKAVENGLDIFRVFDSLNYFGECQCSFEYFFPE